MLSACNSDRKLMRSCRLRPRRYLKETPRVTNPPWKLEAWGMAHVSLETTAALPDSTVTLPDENVTRVGPLSVTNRCKP